MTELDRWLDRVHCGDCLDVLRELPDCSVDLCATDPPYALTSGTGAKGGFMGKAWDAALPARAIWAEVFRVLKPGASCFVCAGARQDTLLGMLTDLREVGFDIQHSALSWVYWCVSADTEALTDKGWRAYSELQVGDSLCTMNVQTGKLEYQPCQAVNAKHYSGPMVRIRGRATDQLLTPNHRVVVKWRRHSGCRYWTDENWSVVEAKDITPHAGVSFPIAAELDGSLDMDPDFAALLGWVITEGHYQSDCGAVNIYQSSTNEKHVQTIRQLLRDLGIQHSEYQGERTYKGKPYVAYQWYINGEWAERIKRWLPDKKPCRELLMLNRSALERMIEACIDGDGCRGDHEVSFYQKDPEILDWFRIACLHLGIGTSRPNSKDGVNLRSPNYQLQTRHIQGSNVAPEQYDGVVWCPSTPNGTFVARRNGYIFITGNSGFPKSTDVGKDIDKAAFLAWLRETPEGETATRQELMGWGAEEVRKAASAAVNGAYSTHEVSEGRQRQCKHGPNEVTRPWEVESGSGTGTRLLSALQARFGDAPGVRQKVGEETHHRVLGSGEGGYHGHAKHSYNENGREACTLSITSAATPDAVAWDGWHSGSVPLKPMTEHILWVTKPAEPGPARNNVLKWGTGAVNIGECRVPAGADYHELQVTQGGSDCGVPAAPRREVPREFVPASGRYPSNLLVSARALGDDSKYGDLDAWAREHGLSEEWLDAALSAGVLRVPKPSRSEKNAGCEGLEEKEPPGSKRSNPAPGRELPLGKPRANGHPTCKPVTLMAFLCVLACPRGGTVLDPFLGSGTTGVAARQCGMHYIGIEREPEYVAIAEARIANAIRDHQPTLAI